MDPTQFQEIIDKPELTSLYYEVQKLFEDLFHNVDTLRLGYSASTDRLKAFCENLEELVSEVDTIQQDLDLEEIHSRFFPTDLYQRRAIVLTIPVDRQYQVLAGEISEFISNCSSPQGFSSQAIYRYQKGEHENQFPECQFGSDEDFSNMVKALVPSPDEHFEISIDYFKELFNQKAIKSLTQEVGVLKDQLTLSVTENTRQNEEKAQIILDQLQNILQNKIEGIWQTYRQLLSSNQKMSLFSNGTHFVAQNRDDNRLIFTFSINNRHAISHLMENDCRDGRWKKLLIPTLSALFASTVLFCIFRYRKKKNSDLEKDKPEEKGKESSLKGKKSAQRKIQYEIQQ
jgi:hypothetical protein